MQFSLSLVTVCVCINYIMFFCIIIYFLFSVVIVIASSAQLSSQGVNPPSSTQEDELAAEVCVVQLQYLDSTEFGK